jgi:zinc transport system ATP-binding protein
MESGDKVLKVSGLKVKYNSHVILDDISFEVNRNETLAVIGPNGAGKTVLFKAILGLIPYTGSVSWTNGVKIGYVPQRLFVGKDIPLTVGELLEFKEKNHRKIISTLESVGLGETGEHSAHKGGRLLKNKIGNLSGGELQRVLICFALLGEPNVLLFDEPTAGVDITGEETVYALIDKLKKEKGLTIIFISHELDIVYKYAQEVLCLNKEKVCFGPPKEAIDKESLQALYGEDIHFFEHRHHA